MKKGITRPTLRFKEFDAEWLPRKIGSFVKERKNPAESKVPLYSLTIESGITPKTARYERAFLVNDETAAYKLMEPNDFASNPMNLRFGALARNRNKFSVKVSRYYDVFEVDDSVSVDFIDEYLRSYNRIQYFDRMSTGTLEEKKRVHFSDLLKFKFLFPAKDEQEKIASFLGAVDEKIQLLEKKRELLEQYKKGVMQKIFSQEIRFKDDDGKDFPDWEMDEVANRIERVPTKYDPKVSDESYPCVELDSIEPDTGRLQSVYVSDEQQSTKGKFLAGDVLFGKLRPYLRKYARPDFDGVCSSEIWVLRGRNDVRNLFVYFLIQSEKFSRLCHITMGSKMPRADWNFISISPLQFPSPDEQKKIAEFLSAIDDKINLVAQQITHMRDFKKGLLQQMFV